MTAEIICVGTELLLGDIVNTNAQFLSRELADVYANGDTLYFWDVSDVEPVDMALVDVWESKAPMSWRYI